MILETKRKAYEEEPKPELTKTKTFGQHEKFIHEVKNDEKNINEQIFKEHLFLSYFIIFSKRII